MEPQPFGHGNGNARGRALAAPRPFNGATAFRPWKPRILTVPLSQNLTHLQWSHSLSAMETARDTSKEFSLHSNLQWSHSLSAMETSRCRSPLRPAAPAFNGATAFRPWKLVDAEVLFVQQHLPSMEPQPFGHGNEPALWPGLLQLRPFNGATAFRPWKRAERLFCVSLNNNLQWSHSLSAMETTAMPTNG